MREAFHTEIHTLADGHYANMSIPQMPTALAPAVIGVVKLNNFMPHNNIVHRTNFTYTGSGGKVEHAIVPEDLATIYNVNPVFSGGNTGQGVTLVVIEDSDVAHTSDWTTFRSKFGLSGFTSGSFTQNPSHGHGGLHRSGRRRRRG